MADARGDDMLALPAPLAIRCVDGPAPSLGTSQWVEEEEEKTSEAHADADADAGATTRTRRFSGDGESISKTSLKERPRAGSAGSQDVEGEDERDSDGGNDSGSARAQLKGKQRASPRSAPAAASSASAQYAMRSPSRLAASLLVGRDRMARAARAWREGARRAGLFGAEDEDYDEREYDEDEHEESKSAWAGDHAAYWSDRASSKRISVSDATNNLNASTEDGTAQEPSFLSIDHDPAEDEPHETLSVRVVRATTLPVSVPRLVPSRLAPATRVPKMAQLWACLDRIECITIREVFTTHDDDDSGATVHYLLDVYHYQEQHSLPTNRYLGTHRGATLTRRSLPHAPSNAPPSRKPDYQIEHRFSSFTKLRRRVLEAAQLKHPNARAFLREGDAVSGSHHRNCAYCRRVALFIASGNECVAPLGWRAKLFTTVETRKTLLGQFISELVFLAREQRDMCSNLTTLAMMTQPPSRHVHRSVPGILRRFLTVQTGENYMR